MTAAPGAASPPGVDACRCPLCGAQNHCAVEIGRRSGQPQSACWCTETVIDAALLERVPVPLRQVACLCPACCAGMR